jgi:hypothetical protein
MTQIYWIIFIIFFIYLLSQPKIPFQNISLDETYKIAKTGDILLFRWNNVDLLHNIISFFTHSGIIVEINNEKYVLETHMKNDTTQNGGVNLYKLSERINMYHGHNFLLRLKNNLVQSNHSHIIQQHIKQYLNLPFFDNYKKYYVQQCLPRKFCNSCFSQSPPDTPFLYCSQFVGIILKHLHLLNPNTNVNCISPYDLIFIENNGNKLYQDIVYRITK